jgi:hypothetical protein
VTGVARCHCAALQRVPHCVSLAWGQGERSKLEVGFLLNVYFQVKQSSVDPAIVSWGASVLVSLPQKGSWLQASPGDVVQVILWGQDGSGLGWGGLLPRVPRC